ncbi:hypothetical protein PQ478_08520 [Alkalihalophilus pseudofirmus]|uniref:hypothetical protein n=1 Tax=Alkalihalophilus pseudofirmus TaxID=79885 RepID=UPI00259B3F99|nr:hypothetical protein [Alkalihalophilus pseudofirmus]WEG18512.1 hypothetical protein PQ478_08520 [Alkalihalophilus pseudofirmus]
MSDKIKCLKCETERAHKEFYMASSTFVYSNGKVPICKKCLLEIVGDCENEEDIIHLLQIMDKPFKKDFWETAVNSESNTFGKYMSIVGMKQNRDFTFKDSDFETRGSTSKKDETEIISAPQESEDRNRDDVIRILGYDPFIGENPSDKRQLYNNLIDYLDDSTLEDSFKLPAVIEIVKTYNQIDKINLAIANITSDPTGITKSTGGIKSLMDAKKGMLASILALAKDNGISANHNNNKSKGSGTLSGIIKQLQEKGFEEAEVNLFDVETSQGMLQVANLSNESIIKQLQFDENDYSEMLIEQRDIIDKMTSKNAQLEEENRKMKKQLISNSSEVELSE